MTGDLFLRSIDWISEKFANENVEKRSYEVMSLDLKTEAPGSNLIRINIANLYWNKCFNRIIVFTMGGQITDLHCNNN